MCESLSHAQTSTSRVMLEASRRDLFVCASCVHNWVAVGFQWTFFFSLFSLFSLPKYNGILSFVFCIQFDHYFFLLLFVLFFLYLILIDFFYLISSFIISFYFYIKFGLYSFYCWLFIYFSFSNWILFLISSLNIWFQNFLYQL